MTYRSRFLVAASVTLGASLVLATARASADENCTGWFCDDGSATTPKVGSPGTATIPGVGGGSDVLSGTVTEVVPGDHITIKLPTGELKTLQWSQFLSLSVSGKIIIGGAPGAAATPPPPAATPVVIAVPPPPPAAAPPPPPPAYDAPPAYQQPIKPAFKERWSLGGRFGVLGPSESGNFVKGTKAGMKDYVGDGLALELNLGFRFHSHWTVYGLYEHSWFKPGKLNAGGDQTVTGNHVGFGFSGNTNPDGVGFLFDAALGYRWLNLPYAQAQATGAQTNVPEASTSFVNDGTTQYRGPGLRIGLGISIYSSRHTRWDLLLNASAGTFTHRKDSNGRCVGVGGKCEEIPEANRATYSFVGLSFGGMFDL